MDLGNTPVTNFHKHASEEEDIVPSHLPQIPHPDQEGLQGDKQTDNDSHHTIPDYIIPAQYKPKHHRPDLIWAVGYILGPNGKLTRDYSYRGKRKLQLIECKYSTDRNIP